MVETSTRQPHVTASGGELNAALARSAVETHRKYVGRGPTRVRAFYRNDVVVVIMRDVLTRAERNLAADGHADDVAALRDRLQRLMRDDLVSAVEALTGCGVTACMAASDVDSDVESHVFVLDRTVLGRPPRSFDTR
jgi:uncharacterized protein YbcI